MSQRLSCSAASTAASISSGTNAFCKNTVAPVWICRRKSASSLPLMKRTRISGRPLREWLAAEKSVHVEYRPNLSKTDGAVPVSLYLEEPGVVRNPTGHTGPTRILDRPA